MTAVRDKVSAEEWAVRVDLAACYRLLVRYGWEDLVFTHITMRVPGADDQFLRSTSRARSSTTHRTA